MEEIKVFAMKAKRDENGLITTSMAPVVVKNNWEAMKNLIEVELFEPRFVEINNQTFEILFDAESLIPNNRVVTAVDKSMNQPYMGSFVISRTEYSEDEGYTELSLTNQDVEEIIRHFGIIKQDNQPTPVFLPDNFLAV